MITHEDPFVYPDEWTVGECRAKAVKVYGGHDALTGEPWVTIVRRYWIYMGRDRDGRRAWASCDSGEFYSSVVYPDAFAVLGTVYGGAASVGLFRVPDLRGVALVGVGEQR